MRIQLKSVRPMVLICCFVWGLPLWAAEVAVTIFHSNDIHQNLKSLPGIAGCVAQYRKQHRNAVFVDAGDFFDRGSSLVPLTLGEAVYGAMAHMGYDMWILGNHDWAYGGSRLCDLMRKYPVPVLGTNLGTTQPSFPANVKRTIIRDFDGVRFGFFGITMDAYGKNPQQRPFFYVLDCRLETARAIAELKQAGVDVIVAVTHLGLRKMKHESGDSHPSDIDLAKEFPDIDVIVGGHSHTLMKEGETQELYQETGAVIVQTDGLGNSVGRLTLSVDPDAHVIKSFECENIRITAGLPEHPETAQFIAEQYARNMPQAELVVGKIQDRLEFYNMAYWYADFIQDKSDAEIVLLPRKTLYDEYTSFKPGELTIEQLSGILYNRYLIKSTVTGADLLKFCNQEKVRDLFNPFHHRGRPFSGDALFYSGFEARFDEATQSVRFSIVPDKKYTLVTPWPFSGADLARHRHVLPKRSAVDLAHPVSELDVSNAMLLEQTTGELLVTEGLKQPLAFTPKYPEPRPDWKPWTEYFEGKQRK